MKKTFKNIIENTNNILFLGQKSFSTEIIENKHEEIDLAGSQIGLCVFNDCKFFNVSFRASNFYECIFNNCVFEKCNFYKCTFAECIFNNCSINNCSITKAEIEYNHILNSNFQNVEFGATIFLESTIVNTTFKENNTRGVMGNIWYGKTKETLERILDVEDLFNKLETSV